ncbi:hypothetical protein ACGFNU_38565 [Spirillospora sp. NPDC048911]|uniref:hypothetical protein n=1 Tax=Spirillospora sp. NPDC048911 TaxID=3364527 RepID=UPI003710D6DE
MSVDDPSAEMREFYDLGFGYANGKVAYDSAPMSDCPLSHRYVLPAKQSGLAYYSHTSWRTKGSTPDAPGPYRYEIYDYRRGEFPVDPSYKARTADMTTVQATVRGRTEIGRKGHQGRPVRVLRADRHRPEGEAEYELTADAERTEPGAKLSTKVTPTWTFRSGHTERPTPLPLRVVRFAPSGLDDLNRAPADKPTAVSLQTDSDDGSASEIVTVDASFDRGGTWRKLPVKKLGDHRVVIITGAKPGTVSLRAVRGLVRHPDHHRRLHGRHRIKVEDS